MIHTYMQHTSGELLNLEKRKSKIKSMLEISRGEQIVLSPVENILEAQKTPNVLRN